MMETPRSGYAVFRPRARLLKLIGAELISDDVVAITELVKNGHDADARTVTVEFRGVTGPDGEIVVRDDGCGMDLETLLSHWMQPAGTSKGTRDTRVTRLGRRVLGEKGVGRFAVDKLGRYLELVSRRRGEVSEIRAFFDWDQFDTDARMLSDIRNRWEIRPASVIPHHGTVLRISGLRSTWNERMFRRLSTRLSRLRSPFQDLDSFTIRIDSDEFPQYAGELRSDFLERAPYRIEASFDGKQTVEVNVNGARSVEHLWNGTSDLRCGPVRVRLFAFDLETDAIARIGPNMEVRAWLREWSGISIYRDGFRIWPYGEPHDDWLRLDQRRVNNPVVRLSNNQIVSFVEISQDRNPDLIDQTNREGLLHNRALEDLRRLLYFILQILEAERQSRRHPVLKSSSGNARVETEKDAIPNTLEKLASQAGPELSVGLGRLAARLREQAARDDLHRRRLSEGYSELAALGQLTTGIAGAVRTLLQKIRDEQQTLQKAVTEAVEAAIQRSLERTARTAVGDRRPLAAAVRSGGARTAVRSRDAAGGSGAMPGLSGAALASLRSLREVVIAATCRRAAEPLETLEKLVAAVDRELSMVAPEELGGNQRRRTIDVVAELNAARQTLLQYLDAYGIAMAVSGRRTAVLRVDMRPEVFQRLVYLLVVNSLDWTRNVKAPTIRITTRGYGDSCELIFSDNGPGIAPELADKVFEPLFSGKENGRGMGLTIARDIIRLHGGDIRVLTDGRRGGATIRILLPRKRPRATPYGN